MDGLNLADVLAQLRANLAQVQQEGVGQDLRFALDDVEVELQVAVTKEGTGKAGVRFWVINAEAGGNLSDVTTQKIKLKMKVVDKDGRPLAIADKGGR